MAFKEKKRKHNSKNIFAVVDPISNEADFKNIKQVPEDKYDAAFICTNDAEKYDLINFLIEKKETHFSGKTSKF